MSGKLDQSLEDITKSRRSANRGNRRGGRAATASTRTGPAAGVTKNSRAAKKNTAAVAATVPIATTGEGKIIVSGLPSDVTEVQIKEYFAKTIGGTKRVFLTYGPNGQSRGIATIIFTNVQKAHDAATQLNGTKVDNRPMKIEVVLGAAQAPAPPAPKGLGERIAQPKNAGKNAGKNAPKTQPKSAAATGTTAKTTAARGKGKARGGRGGKAGRPKPKNADELDAEMTDYFGGNSAAAPDASVAAPATNGTADAGMTDEIM